MIIHNNKNPKVFGFKVSTFEEEIFPSLQKTYETLIFRLNISFGIKINENDIYFGYIFDYTRLNDQLNSLILKKFKENNIKYSFYDIASNSLYLDKFTKTNNIFDIVGEPIKVTINIWKYNPLSGLTCEQINAIIDILKKERKNNKISELKFVKMQRLIKKDYNYLNVVANSKKYLIIFFYAHNLFISKIIINNKAYENNNFYFSDSFHIYKIIQNSE